MSIQSLASPGYFPSVAAFPLLVRNGRVPPIHGQTYEPASWALLCSLYVSLVFYRTRLSYVPPSRPLHPPVVTGAPLFLLVTYHAVARRFFLFAP